jgi:hypothetical protein
MILFLSTRTDPRQEVELEASRKPDGKITQIEISSPLPKPKYRRRIRQRSAGRANLQFP